MPMIDVLCYLLLRAICWKREGAICIFVRGCGYVTCVFYVALVLLLWISVRKMWSEGCYLLERRMMMDYFDGGSGYLFTRDNIYYLRDACYMAIDM